MENKKNITLNELSEGAVPVVNNPTYSPYKLDASKVVEADIKQIAKPRKSEESINGKGTGNPMIDSAIQNIDSTIERLRQDSINAIEKGEEMRAEEFLDSDDAELSTIKVNTNPVTFKSNNSTDEDYFSKAINNYNSSETSDKIKNMEFDIADESDPNIKKIVDSYAEDYNKEATNMSKSISDISDDDLDLFLEDEEEENKTDVETEEERKKKVEAIYSNIREEVNKNFKPIKNPVDISSFKISNKTIPGSRVIRDISNSSVECADGVLFESKSCVKVSAVSALEIEKLNPERTKNENYKSVTIDRLRLIYDHIVSENKPSSFNEWTKTVTPSVINDYFFALYKATFANSNIITYTCNDCDNVFMQNRDINEMIKFADDTVKEEYFNILHNGIYDPKKPKTGFFQICDDYIVELKSPSVYELYIEPSYIDDNFVDKYNEIIRLIAYISNIYKINRETNELYKIDTKPDITNKTLTTKRKFRIFASIIRTLTSDQITALILETNNYDEGKDDTETGKKIPDIEYQYPETMCPKCKKKIEAEIVKFADNLLFTRHQLGLLSKI